MHRTSNPKITGSNPVSPTLVGIIDKRIMTNSNEIKSEQLGMKYGTAYNKLRKSILFELVKETKKDICYRCKKKIENIDELSIEHKEDWLYSDNPKELFFDYNNISFSHLSCNVANSGKCQRKEIGISGYKGVYYDGSKNVRHKKKWRAYISNGKGNNRIIGRFNNKIDAAKAYDNEAIKVFGEKAITNKSLDLI